MILSYYLSGKTFEHIVDLLNRQKRFVSDASHELKSPLTNIKTEAEVLKRSKQTTLEEYKEFTANLIKDVNRLDDLVIKLLDSARSEYEQTPIHKTELNINNLLRNL